MSQLKGRALLARDKFGKYLLEKQLIFELGRKLRVPGDNAKEFPTARSHIVARSLVGIPAHQRFRIAGLRWTAFQSGRISFSHICNDCST